MKFLLVYNQMEDQLVALGERWAHICQWAEERWSKLHLLLTHCTRISDDMQKIQSWIETNETLLKQLEAEPVSEIGEVFQRIKLLQVNYVFICVFPIMILLFSFIILA